MWFSCSFIKFTRFAFCYISGFWWSGRENRVAGLFLGAGWNLAGGSRVRASNSDDLRSVVAISVGGRGARTVLVVCSSVLSGLPLPFVVLVPVLRTPATCVLSWAWAMAVGAREPCCWYVIRWELVCHFQLWFSYLCFDLVYFAF